MTFNEKIKKETEKNIKFIQHHNKAIENHFKLMIFDMMGKLPKELYEEITKSFNKIINELETIQNLCEEEIKKSRN